MRPTMSVQEKIEQLGYRLPVPSSPAGNYVPVVESGGLVYISGQLPKREGQLLYPGQVDGAVSVAHAREAAAATLCALSAFYARFGGFDMIEQFLQMKGYVNASPDFLHHSKVIDGASNILVALFGDAGRHTRVAVGVSSLPSNASVEIQMTLRVTG